MKLRIFSLLLVAPLCLWADAPAPSAVDQKATALESQLNKSLDTSPAAAKVMLELVDLYYNEGRVFGLVRVSERFAKAQSSHGRHREVMLKLIDGLEAMARRDDLITIGRQYLTRYPNSGEALDVALSVSDALERNRKRTEAADVLRLLWEHKPGAATRRAAERASELYGQDGNHRIRIKSAQLCESLLDRLPGNEFTLRAGLRAVNEYRYVSRWVEANVVISKMLKKGGLPLTRVVRRELHRLQAENYISQSQWANAVNALKAARGQGDSWELHQRQIYALYNSAAKAAQINAEITQFSNRYRSERARWVNYQYLGNAYAREGDPLKAARAIVPALPHAGGDGSMATYYVNWLMSKAISELGSATTTRGQTEKALETARESENTKLDTFNKAKDENTKKSAKTAYDAAVNARQMLEAKLRTDTAAQAAKQNTVNTLAAEASRTLTAAVGQAQRPYDKLALRYALSHSLYLDRLRNEAQALTHARAAVGEMAMYTSWMGTLIGDLLYRQPLNAQFQRDVALLLKQRRDHFLDSNYRNYLSSWASSNKGNKEHRAKAQYIATEVAKQNKEPFCASVIHYPSASSNVNKAIPARDEAIKGLNQLSRNNQFFLISVQRSALFSYARKKDPERARALGQQLLRLYPNDPVAVHMVMMDHLNGDTKAEAKGYAQRMLRLTPKSVSNAWVRDLMRVAELNEDGALATQIYQWAIKVPMSSTYSDYVGDILFKLNQKGQALDWWRRVAEMPTQGRSEERNCAERFLTNGGNAPGPWREQTEFRWPGLKHRVAAKRATDTLRMQGNLPAFAQEVQAIEKASAESAFASEDWRDFGYSWREFAYNNETLVESDNPAHAGYKALDEAGKLAVYRVVRDVRTKDSAAWSVCDLLLAGALDEEPAMQRLLQLMRLTKTTNNDQSRWNSFRSFAQKAFEEKRYVASATLLTGVLSHVTNASKESKEEGRGAILRAHSRMGAVGLTIDEDSPMAPLLQAALYLRLGDRDKALELYTDNAVLFKQHRNDLPPDLIEFVCEHLMTGGGEEKLADVEDILRGWLIKFTDPEKSESKQQSEDAKARLQLLLAKSYYKGQRYDVARVEYSTVTNRYNGTPHAIEAKFGIGESFMAQKIYDQAGQVFKALEENPNLQVNIRAEFLTGVLASRQGQRDEAREKFQHILERVPNVELANQTLFSLSEIYGEEQRFLDQLNLLRIIGRMGNASKRLHVPGNALSIVVHDRDLGVSRGQARIPVIVATKPGGDEELVYLRSAASAGKGLFRGEVPTTLGTVKKNDGVLQVTGRDVIESDYPPKFKEQFRNVPLSDVEIRIASDAEFAVASSEIVDEEKETLTQQLQREQEERANVDRRLSQGRPANQVKPGNRVFLRVKDPDRDLGDEPDRLTVTLRADSGDQVQVELEETGPHTGEFRAAIPTAELPAGASATDSAIDHNPLMAIDQSRDSYWQSEPDGVTPKELTVDMKQLHAVSRVRVATPKAADNSPVRGQLLGSHDGVYWFTIASHPIVERAATLDRAGAVLRQRIFAGDHTLVKTWTDVAALSRTGKPVSDENATGLSWEPEAVEAPEGGESPAAPAPHAALWNGQLVQLREGAMRIGVTGDLVAVAVDGRMVLPPSAEVKTVDVWLTAGVHSLEIFAANKTGGKVLAATRARADYSNSTPSLKAFNEKDFDVAAAKDFLKLQPEAGPAPALVVMDMNATVFSRKTEKFGYSIVGNGPRINTWQAPEDAVKWVFDLQRTGAYEVWVKLAHSGGGSRFRMEFGDQLVDSTVPNTGSFNTFAWHRVGMVLVDNAGAQTLAIKPLDIVGAGLMDMTELELRPFAGADMIQRDREWEFFFDPIKLRYTRLQVDEYLGDSVAINHVEVRGPTETFIPTTVDVSKLAENETLEIAGGDVIAASYTDDTSVATGGGSRLLTAELQATYNDAAVLPIGFEFTRNGAGAVAQARKELLRIDPGDRITFEVTDYDMDQTDERDTVPVEIWANGVKWADLNATETEEYSGIFRVEVDTAAAPEAGKLVIQRGDQVFCRYADEQNTFPGHAVQREAVVFANEPTEGEVRVISTRRTVPPPDSEAQPAPIYLPNDPEVEGPVGVNFFVPLTVEVIDPDAAKDSLSTVTVTLNAGTTNAVEVVCALSTAFGDFSDVDSGQANAALRMGRFVGQVKMALGGEGSPVKVPRALGEARGLVGRARPAGVEPDEELDNLLDVVLNVNGKSRLMAKYADASRPDGVAAELTAEGQLVTDGTMSVTDEGYEKPVELLHVGEKLYIIVRDPDLDISDERDAAQLIIASESGEKETVKLEETLSHSGVFAGSFELKAREKPTPANFSGIDREIECYFGDQLKVSYVDLSSSGGAEGTTLGHELPVAIGTDGIVSAFSKIFGNQKLAVQTQFHIAESYFELFKNNLKLERKEESDKALKAGRRILKEVMVDYPDPKYLPRIAYLRGQFSQELEGWNEAANSYALIVRQYPNHTLAADAQYKLAQCYEEANDFDRALEEYVTLAATYPKSPLIPNVMIRINEYFYKLENYEVAAKVAEKFMDRFGDHEFAPKMAFRWGQCHYKAEKFADAGGVFDIFAKKFPDDALCAQALFWAGESYRSASNVQNAFRRYNRCRWDFPESEAAKYARGRLALPEMLAQFESEANSIDDDN